MWSGGFGLIDRGKLPGQISGANLRGKYGDAEGCGAGFGPLSNSVELIKIIKHNSRTSRRACVASRSNAGHIPSRLVDLSRLLQSLRIKTARRDKGEAC